MICRSKTDRDLRFFVKICVGQFMLVMVLLCAFVVPLFGAVDGHEAEPQSSSSFCKLCHPKEVEDIDAKGMAHKTDIDCSDCHVGHKPKSFENIPRCSQCHQGTAHYDQQQCLNCHRNPHQPLEIKLPKKAQEECLTCHEAQGVELQQYPSYHSTLVCTDCHSEHGFLPECMSCHKSHAEVMVEQSCQDCHAPHKPLELAYDIHVKTTFCVPCHPEANELLQTAQNSHSQLSCAECHINRHGFIPACEDCHGKPHTDALHNKFPGCRGCHNTAHNLD